MEIFRIKSLPFAKNFSTWLQKNHVSQFEICTASLQQMIRFFYGFLALCHFYHLHKVIGKIDLETFLWLWPISWLDLFKEPSIPFYILIILGGVLSIACALTTHFRLLRILCFISFFFSLSANLSSVRIVHYYHAVLFTSFWLIFMNLNKTQSSFTKERNQFYLWVTQLSFLGTYFLTGLWKLRKFITSLIEMGWKETKCLETNFALTHIFYNANTSFYKKLLALSEHFGNFLWIGVILFQLSCHVAAWFPSTQRFFALMIMLFHIVTALSMQIVYTPFQYLALILLICNPYQRKIHFKNSINT